MLSRENCVPNDKITPSPMYKDLLLKKLYINKLNKFITIQLR